MARCTRLCDTVCQLLVAGRWFSPGTPVSSTNKTDSHDITEILLNVALNTTNKTLARSMRRNMKATYRLINTFLYIDISSTIIQSLYHVIVVIGSYPSAGHISNVTTCASSYIGDCCVDSYNIMVKNCSGYYVYNLVPPTTCPQGYCFGKRFVFSHFISLGFHVAFFRPCSFLLSLFGVKHVIEQHLLVIQIQLMMSLDRQSSFYHMLSEDHLVINELFVA